jgi:hypothetical protein
MRRIVRSVIVAAVCAIITVIAVHKVDWHATLVFTVTQAIVITLQIRLTNILAMLSYTLGPCVTTLHECGVPCSCGCTDVERLEGLHCR